MGMKKSVICCCISTVVQLCFELFVLICLLPSPLLSFCSHPCLLPSSLLSFCSHLCLLPSSLLNFCSHLCLLLPSSLLSFCSHLLFFPAPCSIFVLISGFFPAPCSVLVLISIFFPARGSVFVLISVFSPAPCSIFVLISVFFPALCSVFVLLSFQFSAQFLFSFVSSSSQLSFCSHLRLLLPSSLLCLMAVRCTCMAPSHACPLANRNWLNCYAWVELTS